MLNYALDEHHLETIIQAAIKYALANEHVEANLKNRLGMHVKVEIEDINHCVLVNHNYDKFGMDLHLVLSVTVNPNEGLAIYKMEIPFEPEAITNRSYHHLSNEDKEDMCRKVYDIVVAAKVEEQIINELINTPRTKENAFAFYGLDQWITAAHGSLRKYRISMGTKLLKEQNG